MQILHVFTKFSTRILLFLFLVFSITFCVSSFSLQYDKTAECIKDVTEINNTKLKISSFPVIDNNDLKFEAKIIKSSHSELIGLNANVVIKNQSECNYTIGDTAVVCGKWILPSVKDNDGGFDAVNYYKSKNIYGTLYSEGQAKFFKDGSNLFIQKISNLRNKFTSGTKEYLKPRYTGVVNALVTGDKDGISKGDANAFKKSGVYHIVSISGLHLNIFIMFISYFISALNIKRFIKALLSAVFCTVTALFVLFFTGMGLSVMRAFFMLVISLGSNIFSRKYNAGNALTLSMSAILVFMPYSFYSIGFRLSVLSTYAVLTGSEVIKRLNKLRHLSKIIKTYFVSVFVTSVFCSLFTLPVTIDSFGYVPVYSFAANMLILPVVTPALALGVLFGIALAFGLGFFARLISYPLSALVYFIVELANAISKIPGATANLYPLYTVFSVMFLVALSLGIIFIYKNKMRSFICMVLIFSVAGCSFLLYNKNNLNAKVIFADVGQGDCAIVSLPQNRSFMIDFGTNSYSEYIIDEIKATLVKNNIPKLSGIFVSHYHKDHISGVENLVKEGYTKKLFLPKYFDINEKETDQNRKKLFDAALKSNTPIIFIDKNTRVDAGPDAVFEVLSPNGDMVMNANDMSAVIKLCYGNVSFLFAGDICDDGTIALSKKDADCDVLKVPHHGAFNKMGNLLIEKTSPQYAVISCGENNIYGHPDSNTLKLFEDANTKIYRTDKMGAITFEFNKENIKSAEKMR